MKLPAGEGKHQLPKAGYTKMESTSADVETNVHLSNMLLNAIVIAFDVGVQ
jgi:hypothetical protein